MTASIPLGSNAFVPTFEAQADFQVNFTRNPNRFALNQYVQVRPRNKTAGKFLKISTEEQARIVTSQDFIWPDGEDRPTGEAREFEFLDWSTTRYSESANVSYETSRTASWQIGVSNLQMHASRRMLARTNAVVTALTTSGNYTASTNYFASGTAQVGGAWTTTGNVQKGIQAATKQIAKATLSTVQPSDIVMVIGPDTANTLSQTTELKDYVKNYPMAFNFLTGTGAFGNAMNYGLPNNLWGVRVVVEDAVIVSTRKKSDRTFTSGYALGANKVVFVSRPGALVSELEGPNFSSVGLYVYDENDMKMEVFDEPKHHRNVYTLTDQFGASFVAPASAYYIADISS